MKVQVGRHVEDRGDARRIEDRHPAHADPFGARGEPERVDGVDHGIIERLGHGEAAEPLPLRGPVVGEHGDLAGRIVEAGELEPRIERGAVGRLHLPKRPRCSPRNIGGARRGAPVLDEDEAPRLGQSDRRRETGDADQPLDGAVGKRGALEAAHVAPPSEQIEQLLPERSIELRRLLALGLVPPLRDPTLHSRAPCAEISTEAWNGVSNAYMERGAGIGGELAD